MCEPKRRNRRVGSHLPPEPRPDTHAAEAGDGASCDALYERSEFDTEYETFGLTCGERFEPEDAPYLCEGEI